MLMQNKKGLIMGVANDRSIAWGIAKTIVNHGGQVAFTYQGEVLKKRVQPLAESDLSGVFFGYAGKATMTVTAEGLTDLDIFLTHGRTRCCPRTRVLLSIWGLEISAQKH